MTYTTESKEHAETEADEPVEVLAEERAGEFADGDLRDGYEDEGADGVAALKRAETPDDFEAADRFETVGEHEADDDAEAETPEKFEFADDFETADKFDAADEDDDEDDRELELETPADSDSETPAELADDRPEEAYVEEGNRWSGDGPVSTVGQFLTPDPSHPESADLVVAATPDAPVETAAAAGLPVVKEPLLDADTEQGFLTRWNEIQIGFVEDPAQSVRNADGLIEDIASAYVNEFGKRRDTLTAAWQDGDPGTEELRLALQAYRSFIGVVLPKYK